MNAVSAGIVPLAAVLLAMTIVSRPVPAEPLTAGVAVVDVTPPLGYRMSGYFSERLSTGVHDPLLAKALVLEQGKTQAALVFCDIIGISLDVSAKASQRASRKTGIPATNILIAATHSHTGPLYFGALRNHFHDLTLQKHGSDPLEKVDYPAQLTAGIVEAIAKAQAAARPVRIETGVARQSGLSFNRRFHMKNGTVRFNPGKLNPNIVRVAGPIDPDVGILLLRDPAKNNPRALLTVFALHLDTVGGTECAADYPYYLERSLRAKLGPELTSMFGNGTCGDINHVDVASRGAQKGFGEAERIGTTLAGTVLAQVPKLAPLRQPSLAVRSATVDAPLQQFTPEQIAQAKRDMVKIGTREMSFLDQVRTYKITATDQREGKTIPLQTQVFRISRDVAIVGLPGEVFVDLGLAIKRASPFRTTLVVELCNDTPGYIPTRKAFAEGSYETVNSRVQPGGGEMLAEAAVRLLMELGQP